MGKWLEVIGIRWRGKAAGWFELRNWWRWVFAFVVFVAIAAVMAANQFWAQLEALK